MFGGGCITVEAILFFKGGVVHLDLAGSLAVPFHVFSEVPALGLVKNSEKKSKFLHRHLSPVGRVQRVCATDQKRPHQA